MPPSVQPFALYNPALLSPEALLGEFIARQPLLETLLDTIRQNAPGHAPQHLLLVGPRGMGKTTTLWAIAHRVNRDPALAAAWLPVVFDEESRRVGDLADFWLEAIRQWEHATQSPGNLTRPLLDRPGDDIEARARQTFLDAIAPGGRRILLLIDNLNEVLASIRDPEPLHRLRAFLMDESRVMLIGGATRYFPQITDLDQPFYDFFRVFELKPLSLDEMKACLLALAKTRDDPVVEKTIRESAGTLRALHLLTGGNPRLIKTFYRLLAEGLRGDIRADLERLLDESTPYLKSIVDALPTQQQRIFDAVALHWDPVDVAALAHATRVPSNQISAQLRMLVKAGHIAEAAGQPKKKTYLLADRFSNIHYLMRHGRAARSRFDWFVAILRLVFPDKAHADAFAKLALQTAECGTDGMRDARDLLHSAIKRSESADAKRQLLNAMLRESWDSPSFKSIEQWLDLAEAKRHLPESQIIAVCRQMPENLRRKIGYNPDDSEWWYSLASFFVDTKKWEFAKASYRKVLKLNPQNASAWNDLGNIAQNEDCQPRRAEVYYRKAISIDAKFPYPWNGLGNALQSQGKHEEAEKAYHNAINLDPSDAYPWNGLGNLLALDPIRAFDAKRAFHNATVLDPREPYPWNGLGNLYLDAFNDPKEAVKAYQKAMQLDPTYASPPSGIAEALYKIGGDLKEARIAAVKAMTLDPNRRHAREMFRLLCAEDFESWSAVLPMLLKWCATQKTSSSVIRFTFNGIIHFAKKATPSKALELLNALPEAAAGPFETLRDAFVAHADRAHLDRLAPERRVIAIELLNRITEKATPQKPTT